MKKLWILLLPLSFLSSHITAQEVTDSSVVVLKEGRFIYQGRIYKENASYVTLGYGAGWNLGKNTIEQNMILSYHHFIKGLGLFGGYHSSSDNKIWWRSYQKLNDVFIGAGKRWENTKLNAAIFAGPALSYGSYKTWNPEKEKEWAYGFLEPGLFIEAQLTYQILYDVGIGLTCYSSLNRYYKVAGAEIHLFFSTAYVRNFEKQI